MSLCAYQFNFKYWCVSVFSASLSIIDAGGMLVADKKECGGSEISKGYQPSIVDCANQCKETASMFALGTNDYGKPRCNNNGCTCLCETSVTITGSCDQVNHDGYRLYKNLLYKGTIFVYYYYTYFHLIFISCIELETVFP